MIQFFTPELTDRDLVDSYFLPSGYRCCEYAFTNIFAWRDAFHEEITAYAGYLTVRCAGPRYFWPAGKGDIRPMLQALELDAKAQGKPLSFYSLTEEEKDRLEQLYPGKFTFTLARDGFDYCYDIDRLADLTGKKLHAKRNHIHRFEEHYPDWTVEEIGSRKPARVHPAQPGLGGRRCRRRSRGLERPRGLRSPPPAVSSTSRSWAWKGCCSEQGANRWRSLQARAWAGTPMTCSLKRLTARFRALTP